MIEFYSETDFTISKPEKVKNWIIQSITSENHKEGEISFIFCDDEYLHDLNVKFLNHDTLTDIITFDYCIGKEVHGEIYISVERVNENASDFKVAFDEELRRVIIHGVLHLCGYKDKSKEEKLQMRAKEDFYLQNFSLLR